MDQRKGTPYWGIIAETGMWPYHYIVKYKKMMFVHNLVNSNENRIAKTILIEQSKENKTNYYNEIKAVTEELGIKMDIKTLAKTT